MSLDLTLTLKRGDFILNAAFAIKPDGVTALFGHSGSGKSSLGQAICGLIRPVDGRIMLGERVMFDQAAGIHLPPERRRIGTVFQDARLFPHMTVAQNLFYGLRRTSTERRDIGPERVIDLLGLRALLPRRPANLSGGEAQRVAIGRALLSQPELLVMDEPLAALDFARREEILDFLIALRAEIALPILFISHAIDEVAKLADDMIVLDRGEIIAKGSVSQVMAEPDLVGRLAGEGWGALIEGRVAGRDLGHGLTEIAFPGGRLKVSPIDGPLGQKVRLRVKARDIIIGLGPVQGLSVQNSLPAVIEALVDCGQDQVDVVLGLGPTRLVARITGAAMRRLDLHAGQNVQALIKSVATDRLM